MIRAMRFLLPALLLVWGCSSSGSEPASNDGAVDSSIAETANDDTGSMTETNVEEAGSDGFVPDLGAEAPMTGGCFSTSSATTATCVEACKDYDTCTFSFGGTCSSACSSRAAVIQQCAKSAGGTCAALEFCVKCALICEQADMCPGTPSVSTCCGNCAARPECINNDLPVCDAIKKATVGCPPKMM